MKTVMSLMTALSVAAALPATSQAGQGEWATAGKVLAGVVAGGVLVEALRPHPAPVVTYSPPAPSVVYAYPPAPSVVYAPAPAPTVVYAPAPAPTVVYAPAPAPVVVVPSPYYCYGPVYHGPLCRPVYAHPHCGGHAGVVVHFGGRW